MSETIPLSAAASTAPATVATTIPVSTTVTTRISAATTKVVATAVNATTSAAAAPRVLDATVTPRSRAGRAIFHQLRPAVTTTVTAAGSTSATVATAPAVPARAAATFATSASTGSFARVAIPATSLSTAATTTSATTSATFTASATSDTATASSSPRDRSPYRYQTVFKHVLFGRRARQIVMNVYSRLRIECPSASYNDIVKQTTHLTGVAHATIFSWKKIVDPIDNNKKPPPKTKRRSKNASSSPRNGAKRGPKALCDEELGSENQVVPKKVQRKKLASSDNTQAGQVAAQPARSGKVQQKKLVTLDNEDNKVVRQPVRARKTRQKKVNPVERPSSQETTRHVACPGYQTNQRTAMSQGPWKSLYTQQTAVVETSQAATTYAEPWRVESNQLVLSERHTNQAGAMPCKQGRNSCSQPALHEQPVDQANTLAANPGGGPSNQPFRYEQHASQVGTSGEPRTSNQCRVWWTSQ